MSRLSDARERIIKLEVQREAQEGVLGSLRQELETFKGTIENLRLAVLELQTLAAQPAPPMWGNVPLHVTEDEEDAKWQLDNGMIDKKMYDEILAEAGLEPNVQIHY